jgi:hypothetical protein
MKHDNQLTLFNPPHVTVRKVVYTPPPSDVVDKYAYAVCKAYGAKYGTETSNTEFVQGFKSFVRAVVKARVSQMNKGVSL